MRLITTAREVPHKETPVPEGRRRSHPVFPTPHAPRTGVANPSPGSGMRCMHPRCYYVGLRGGLRKWRGRGRPSLVSIGPSLLPRTSENFTYETVRKASDKPARWPARGRKGPFGPFDRPYTALTHALSVAPNPFSDSFYEYFHRRNFR